MQVVANRTGLTPRALHRLELRSRLSSFERFGYLLWLACLMFGFPGKGRLQGFGGFHPSLNEQVRNQPRTGFFGGTVHCMMQAYAILFMMLPAIRADCVERIGELSKRLLQGYSLLWRGMQLYSHRSVHTNTLPYMSRYSQTSSRKERGAFLPQPESVWVPCAHFYGEIVMVVSEKVLCGHQNSFLSYTCHNILPVPFHPKCPFIM